MIKRSKTRRSKGSYNLIPFNSRKAAMSLKKASAIEEAISDQGELEGKLQKWFLRIVQSNHDLATALERLRDYYKELLPEGAVTEAQKAVLLDVEISLRQAENVRELN